MARISSQGIGSGLDVDSIIKSLVGAEGAGQYNRIDKKEIKAQAELSGVSSFKGSLSQFQSSLSTMLNPDKFSGRKVSNSDDDLLSASATGKAQVGSYTIGVSQLAEAHKLKSNSFASSSTVVGTGTLTFQFGTYQSGTNSFTLNPDKSARTITIGNNEGSLEGIRNAINSAKIGVTASIINDGNGSRLIISSDDTGAKNSLKISVVDADGNHTNASGLSQLAYDPTLTAGAGKNLTQTVAAVDATINIDGITVTHSSNVLNDVIDGVTLTLKKVDTEATTKISVGIDKTAIKAKVNTFVTMFNSFVDEMKKLTKYNPETKQASILTGDVTLRAIDSSIRHAITNKVPDLFDSSFYALSEIGVKTKLDGSLELDASKLDKAIDQDPTSIARLFCEMGVADDTLIHFDESDANTIPGQYGVNITQMATQGKLVGSAAANTVISQGVNDTLVFDVDGKTTTIVLSPGTYTATSLAAECQSRLNGSKQLTENELSVVITQSSGVLTILSDSYGVASHVSIVGGNGKTDLLGTTPVETVGVDVAGTIGGISAKGEGQYLTGTGKAEGLKIEVTGGSIGNRGNVNFTRGVAHNVHNLVESYLDSEGVLDSREKLLNTRIKNYGKERQLIDRRMQDYEKRMLKQFTALDKMVSTLQATGNYLVQQLSNMPINNHSNKR